MGKQQLQPQPGGGAEEQRGHDGEQPQQQRGSARGADTEEKKQQRKSVRKQRKQEAKGRKAQLRQQGPQVQQQQQPICIGIDVGAANLFTSLTFRAIYDITSQPMRQPPYFDREGCRMRACKTNTCPKAHSHKEWARRRCTATGEVDFRHPGRFQVSCVCALCVCGGNAASNER